MEVILNDHQGISVEQEMDFGIDLLRDTNPISVSPYRMASSRLKEFKFQLKDCIDKGFIQPSIFEVLQSYF